MSSPISSDEPSPLARLVRRLLIVSAALLVPVLPLIVLGLSFEERIESLLSVEMTLARRFWLIVGLLSVDIVLPIPSSAVSTYGGGRIGLWPAFAASFLGMTLGSLVGYALARWLGEPFAAGLLATLTSSVCDPLSIASARRPCSQRDRCRSWPRPASCSLVPAVSRSDVFSRLY